MAYNPTIVTPEPARSAIDAASGAAVVEFGTPWCGHCRATQPMLQTALNGHAQVAHLKIEDGPGRALGRSFGVKLWPTLVFLKDGKEVARLVRPTRAAALDEALALIDPA